MPTIAFYLLSALAIFAGLFMIGQRHPLTAAASLVVCFMGLAGLYAMLMAPLMAVIQILVYAGAIMALVVFVIMLLNVRDEDLPAEPNMNWHLAVSLAVTAPLFLILSRAIGKFSGDPVAETELVKQFGHVAGQEAASKFGTSEAVGLHLFNHFVVPFEIISLLLTVAVVGVVVLAKRRI